MQMPATYKMSDICISPNKKIRENPFNLPNPCSIASSTRRKPEALGYGCCFLKTTCHNDILTSRRISIKTLA